MTQALNLNQALQVDAAQYSSGGIKAINEDSLGIRVPEGALLAAKGVALVVADGVSSAEAGRQASESAVQSFLNDFYSTPDTWSIKTSGERVLSAVNRWLYGQGQQYINIHQGFLTTFTALVLRGRTAHVFHVGDTRVYRLRDGTLELLTKDHAMRVNADTTYLTRALGMDWYVEIDYATTDVQEGDLFFSSSDGVHGFVPRPLLQDVIADETRSLEERCRHIVSLAGEYGSDDNMSCQLVKVSALPTADIEAARLQAGELPFPPDLEIGQTLDGYRIEAEIHASPRSHLYRVRDLDSGAIYALKAPSRNLDDDPVFRAHFTLEEWIGLRIDSPHVVRMFPAARPRQCLYYLQEYLEGETLRDWAAKNPLPSMQSVAALGGQIIKGLRALHRRETLHQDIKPDNIFLCRDGTAKLIDLGAAHVASLHDDTPPSRLGAAEYAAPEYALNRARDTRAEQFSLALTLYELLTGQHPYGDEAYIKASSLTDFHRLPYTSACRHNPHVPLWADAALKKALSINPGNRYESLGEFHQDLIRPNPALAAGSHRPWLERNPLRFWQVLSGLLAVSTLVLLLCLLRH
jgi:serine/threonine protein phosphatase PrpC